MATGILLWQKGSFLHHLQNATIQHEKQPLSCCISLPHILCCNLDASDEFCNMEVNKMLIGYARVSTNDQNLALQKDALKKAGCEKVFEDQITGTRADRPGLQEALSYMRLGDTLVVWKLDRVGRSLKHLVAFMTQLEERNIEFRSLTESIDTNSSMGTFFFHVMAAMAQMERDLIVERTNAGLEAARARGRLGGRPRKVDKDKLAHVKKLLNEGKQVKEVAHLLGVDRSTIYRRLKALDK